MNNLLISKKTESWLFIWLFVLTQISFFPQFIKNIFSLATCGFIFLVIINRPRRFTYVATKEIFLLLLVLLAIASVFWSTSPGWTLFKLRYLLPATLLGVYLAVEYTPRNLIQLLTRVCVIVMILCVLAVLLFPSDSLQLVDQSGIAAWKGIFNHKQVFGPFIGFAGSIFVIHCFDSRMNRWFALSGLGFAVILMLLSASKTGLVMFFLSLYLMPLYKIIRQGKQRIFLLYIMLIFYVAIGLLFAINLETLLVDTLGKDIEFNGRVPIWTLAIETASKSPWLGYGYNGFWTSDASNYIINNVPWVANTEGFRDGSVIFHSHNGYIDLFLQLGLLGFTLFAISLFRLFKSIIYLAFSTRSIETFFYFQIIILSLLHIFINGTMLLSDEMLWVVYVAIALSSAVEYSRIKRNQQLSISSDEFIKNTI
jgi:exopolysaccharide production protein ExoQ